MGKPEVIRRKVGSWFSDAANYVVTDEVFINTISTKLSQKMIEKAKEKAGIEIITWQRENNYAKEPKNSTTFVMVVQIAGINLTELAEKGLGLPPNYAVEFEQIYHDLGRILERIGMPQKAQEMEASVYTKVRWKVMVKLRAMLPVELGKEPTCLETQCSLPELDDEKPPGRTVEVHSPELLGMAASDPFLIQAKIEDRKALLQEHSSEASIKTSLKTSLGVRVPGLIFERMLEIKLKKQIPELLLAQAGLHVTCRRVRRRGRRERNWRTSVPAASDDDFDPEGSFFDVGEGDEKSPSDESPRVDGGTLSGIIVEITINAYDAWPPTKLLTLSKGKSFSNSFVQLWIALERLQELGVPGIVNKMVILSERIKDQVREGVGKKLQEVLSERLHAKVRLLEGSKAEGYTEIKFNTGAASF